MYLRRSQTPTLLLLWRVARCAGVRLQHHWMRLHHAFKSMLFEVAHCAALFRTAQPLRKDRRARLHWGCTLRNFILGCATIAHSCNMRSQLRMHPAPTYFGPRNICEQLALDVYNEGASCIALWMISQQLHWSLFSFVFLGETFFAAFTIQCHIIWTQSHSCLIYKTLAAPKALAIYEINTLESEVTPKNFPQVFWLNLLSYLEWRRIWYHLDWPISCRLHASLLKHCVGNRWNQHFWQRCNTRPSAASPRNSCY